MKRKKKKKENWSLVHITPSENDSVYDWLKTNKKKTPDFTQKTILKWEKYIKMYNVWWVGKYRSTDIEQKNPQKTSVQD